MFSKHFKLIESSPNSILSSHSELFFLWISYTLSLIICDGRGFRLEQAVRAIKLGGFGLMVLAETKISTVVYCQNWLGCNTFCFPSWSDSSSGSQGDVGPVFWDHLKIWGLEFRCFHGTNMVSYKVVTGMSRTPTVGSYLPPSTLSHLHVLEEALSLFWGQDPIILVDINVQLDEAQNLHSHIIADLLKKFGLINLMHHFQKCLHCNAKEDGKQRLVSPLWTNSATNHIPPWLSSP